MKSSKIRITALIITAAVTVVAIALLIAYECGAFQNNEKEPSKPSESESAVSEISSYIPSESRNIEIVPEDDENISPEVPKGSLPFKLEGKYDFLGLTFKYVIIADANDAGKISSGKGFYVFPKSAGEVYECEKSLEETEKILSEKGVNVISSCKDTAYSGIKENAETGIIVFGG